MENPNNNVTVTPSKFAMWRAAISLAYCDGHLSNSEAALIHDWWKNFHFSDDQVTQLENDMRDGVDFEIVYPLITEPADRAHLIDFSMILFHIDDDYSALEKKMWDLLNERQRKSVDYAKAIKDAQQAGDDYLNQERIARAKELETHNPFKKASLYLVNATMDNEEFDKTVW